MNTGKLAWAAWSILPVIVLAYHFGPGQAIYQRDKAAQLLAQAGTQQDTAQAAQDAAHEKHLAWVAARRRAIKTQNADDQRAAEAAAKEADEAYAKASGAWHAAADTLGKAQGMLETLESPKAGEARIARDRALIRSGDIAAGVNDLDGWLDELTEKGQSQTPIAKSARAEAAAGYYYAARLMRLAGKPASEWMEAASWARQDFRFVAELDAAGGDIGDQQKNLEIALNLEQSDSDDLVAMPLLKNSPCNGKCDGINKLGKGKKPGKKPGQPKDARGAGGESDIPAGW
ncbi:MAG: hypothetical protein GC200_06820 [Tepidisphaera sp.]|nr:hypothetical protein [Tepidisphaera sp.]